MRWKDRKGTPDTVDWKDRKETPDTEDWKWKNKKETPGAELDSLADIIIRISIWVVVAIMVLEVIGALWGHIGAL